MRFESQCVVIPDSAHHSRRPRVVTKSYALPLWRRRPSFGGPPASDTPKDATCEENPSHLVLRVPLPMYVLPCDISLMPKLCCSFSLKSHPIRPADPPPLPPCLVHRPQPSDPSSPSLNRHARTPRKTSPSPSRSDIVTVPLRPCCVACQPVTDAARVNGDTWPEHFSRAAARRRSLSVDGPRTVTLEGSAASASYGALGVAISVDEIDKRRRASDLGPSTTSRVLWSDTNKDECGVPPIHCRTVLSNANASPTPSPSRMTAAPATPRIPEEEDDGEDESELFPLPSPKRTPSVSPAPSVTGSISSLVAPPHQRSGTSPAPSTCSGESVPPALRRLLAPPQCASSSSLSLPVLPGSTSDLSVEDLPRVPSPSLLSTLPSISARNRSPLPAPADAANRSVPHETESSLAPVQQPPASSPRLPWRAKRAATSPDPQAPAPETSLPSFAPHAKKPSFSMPSPLQIFSEVLRGVSPGGMPGV